MMYNSGNWDLPSWWTNGPPMRRGRATHTQQVTFYNSQFMKTVIGHTGGITDPPDTILRKEVSIRE